MPVHWTRPVHRWFRRSRDPCPPRLVRVPRWRRPAGGTFLRDLASLELRKRWFWTVFQREFIGRLTKEHWKKSKSERSTWCAQVCGNTAHCSTQPRYRKGGTRIFFLSSVRNVESLQFAESRPQRRTYSDTDPFVLFQTLRLLRFSVENKCFSGSRRLSQLRADTTSAPAAAAAAAAAVAGLESTKGSAPGATSGSTEPKSSMVEAAFSIVLTVSLPASPLY